MRNKKTLFLVQFALLLAIEAIVCFTPLGSLPAIGPIVATLAMVPVVITAILLGTLAGTLMGFFTGLFSLIVWTFMPPSPIIAFVFSPFYSLGAIGGNAWSLVICFVPRILTGTVAGATFKALKKTKLADFFVYGFSGFLGSMMNTLLVLGGIYAFFGQDYAGALGIGYNLLLGIIGTTLLTSGIPEAVIAWIAAFAVCKPLHKILSKQH
jgi:uncharacterized membrane protein